jgi:Carboxypeptidase regulatory-like domain
MACGLLAAVCLAVVATPASAQHAPVDRTVEGKVIDKSGAPLKGAVVYLKDDHTLAVKSFIVDDAGHYRFGQLKQSTDFELWAELEGKKSNTRTISSFDNKNEFVINLKIDK